MGGGGGRGVVGAQCCFHNNLGDMDYLVIVYTTM